MNIKLAVNLLAALAGPISEILLPDISKFISFNQKKITVMNLTNLKRTFVIGMIVTLVLEIIVYYLIKVVGVFENLIAPITHRLGMENVFGKITITFLAILTIIILAFILGSIYILPSVSRYKDKLENFLFNLYPLLNYFKVMTDEKFQVDSVRENWKSVLALIDDQYMPAFIIEENDEW